MDIKALKKDVWELLKDTSTPAAPQKKKGVGGGAATEVSFQKVLGRLDERVPPAKLPDVSFAYCFICLLHLANENGLEIEASADMTDLTVSGS